MGIIFRYIIAWIFYVAVLVGVAILLGPIGWLMDIIIVIGGTVKSLSDGDYLMAFSMFSPAIIVTYFIIQSIIENKKLEAEKKIREGYIQNYISENGFTSPMRMYAAFCGNSAFETERNKQYTNPEYTRQKGIYDAEQEERKKNPQKYKNAPEYQITAPSTISFDKICEYEYRVIVISTLMNAVTAKMTTIKMFDLEQLSGEFPDYSEFFTKENGEFDIEYFNKSIIQALNKLIESKKIKAVSNIGKPDAIYESNIAPDEVGNVIEGEVLEI